MFGGWRGADGRCGGGLPGVTGELQFSEECNECSICLETKNESVKQLRCAHVICAECFQRCHHGPPLTSQPFPYPELEDEYYEDQDNEKWERDYPLIADYNEHLARMDDARQLKQLSEENLRICPICRM
jgi:hypothetical protein